jgi:hypothetical protein
VLLSRERASLRSASSTPCGADGRPKRRPSACESFALALLTSSGPGRDPGPFQSRPNLYPITQLLVVTLRVVCRFGTQFRAVVLDPPRLLATDLRAGPRCCSDTARCQSPPARVRSGFPAIVARLGDQCGVSSHVRVTGGVVRFHRLSDVREGAGRAVRRVPRGWGGRRCGAVCGAVPRAITSSGAVAVCGCGADAVLWRSRSNIPFAPDRVAVLVWFALLSRSRSVMLSLSQFLIRYSSQSPIRYSSQSSMRTAFRTPTLHE